MDANTNSVNQRMDQQGVQMQNQIEDLCNKLSHSDFRLSFVEGNKPMKKSCSTSNLSQTNRENNVTGMEQQIHKGEEQLKTQSQMRQRSQDFHKDHANSNRPMDSENYYLTKNQQSTTIAKADASQWEKMQKEIDELKS